nr:retrovirus-related Pol polyprotein from transposon TNT 1-94 [Tanacetum cinerariifolium]
ALIAEKTNVSRSKEKVVVSSDSEGSEADDFSELKKITALLEKAFNRRKFYSKPTNNNLRTSSTSQSANKKQEFVKTDDKKVEKKADEKKRDMSRVKFYNCKKKGHFAKDCKKAKDKDYEYYKTKMLLVKKDKGEQVLLAEDQASIESSKAISSSADEVISKGLFVNNDDDQEIFHDAIESASENFIENHIDSQKDYDKSDLKELIEKNNDLLAQTKVLKDQLQVKHVVIDTHVECHEKYAKLEAERYEYMIRYSAYFDNEKQHRKQIADQKVLLDKMSVQMVELDKHVRDLKNTIKGIGFENPSYFEKAKDLRPTLYDEKVIGLGYTPMFFTHSNEALEIKKFKRSRENKIEFAYDYGNLNASYVNEKINFKDDYFQEIINPDLKRLILQKEKVNLETIESLKSKSFESSEKVCSELENQTKNDCLVVEKECDKEENSKVIASGIFKLNVSQCVSPILMSKSSCDSNNVEIKLKIKRHKRKSTKQNVNQVNNDVSRANSDFVHFSDLDTFSSVRRPKNSGVIWKKKRLCDGLDDNNFFIFDDVNVRISPVSKMPFRKKPCDSMHIVQIYLWIIDLGCSKHLTGNRALLTNFMEQFLEMVRFGNNEFAVIAGYGDVVIGSMTIKKVYYVEGLGHNLFSVGQFCDKGLDVAFRKSTCFVRNEDGVDLLIDDRSSNLYTIALNEVASNSSNCLLAKASSSQSWLWHQQNPSESSTQVQRVRTDNGTEFKNKTLAKFFDEVGITQQFSAARTPQQNGLVERRNRTLVEAARTMLTFSNIPSFLWAEAIAIACFTENRSIIHKHFDKTPYELINKRKPNINFFRMFGCRCYLLNDYEDIGNLKAKGDIRVFVGYSKESAAFKIYNKRTRKIHESVNVNFDEISEMASKQFSLEPGLSNLNEMGKSSNQSVSKVMKSSTTNVETPIIEEVFHEVSESFQGESFSSSLNDDVQQSQEEVILPQTNTQSIPINMVPNSDEASTSHDVFNKRLEDAYFDASFIEPANMAEALRDADWVSAMQEDLDQFARLKVWRLVPRPEGKSVIKTKWIFKNKKDESSLAIRNKARLVVIGIDFENPSYFEKAKDLRPTLYDEKELVLIIQVILKKVKDLRLTLYDEKVIGLGYTSTFLTHSDEALEIEKFKRSRENKIEFAYDYGNLNASYVNEKINFEDDYFQEIINPNFEKIDSSF